MKKTLTVGATLAVALGLGSTQAFAVAGRVYDGTGYHVANEVGDQYLDTGKWYIDFYDTYSRSKLSAYAKLTATELHNATGLTFVVTTTVNTYGDTHCPGHTAGGSHRILLELDKKTTRANTYMCSNSNHSDSAKVYFADTEWNSKNEVYKRHVTSHELGHAVGLGHPKVCSLNGTDPLMCGSYWGGYWTNTTAQKYTGYDVNGLKQLVKNRSL